MLSDRLSTTLSALADPTRRAILARLALGEASVGELAEPFTMSLPGISKHLKVLEAAPGLIARGRTAQWRAVPAGGGGAERRLPTGSTTIAGSGKQASIASTNT